MNTANLKTLLNKLASDFQNQKNLSNTPDENGKTNQRDVNVANQAIQTFLHFEKKISAKNFNIGDIKIKIIDNIKHFERITNLYLIEEEGVRKINPRASSTAAWAARELESVLEKIQEI